MCCVCATIVAATKTNPPKKRKKEGEFCASIIAATKWLWSVAIAPAIAIPVVAALVAINRRMTGWMKCLSGWMDHGTALGEASFNIPSSFTLSLFVSDSVRVRLSPISMLQL
jgi:hypothetical protein